MIGVAVLVSALTRQGPSLGALAFQQLYHSKQVECLLISRYTTLQKNRLIGDVKLTSTYLKMWLTLNFGNSLSRVVSFDLKADLVNILSKGRSIIYIRANNKENYTDTFGRIAGLLLFEFHKLILYRAYIVFALSETMKEEYRGNIAIYDKIQVLPNFIDQQSDLNLTKTKNSFLIVASLIPRKRVIETVECFIAEFCNKSEVTLTVIGDGVLKSSLENIIDQGVYMFKLEYISESIDPSAYFASHAYFILMSKSEGISRSSLEAANSGCKLLLSSIDVHKEYFSETALLLDDFEDLRIALRDCYDGKVTVNPAFPLVCSQSFIWSKLEKL